MGATKRMSKFDDIYYIHQHQKNIGNIASGSTINFAQLKQQSSKMLINQYSKLWSNSVGRTTKVSKLAIENLSNAVQLNETELFSEIDNQIMQKLQSITNTKVLNELHSITKSNLTAGLFESIVDKKDINSLSQLFDTLNNMLNVVDGNNTLGLALLLNDFIVDTNDFYVLGSKLSARLIQWRNANEGKVFTQQQIDQINKIGNYLDSLVYVLENQKFKTTGNPLSAKGLSTLLVNGFNATALAETFGITCNNLARKGIKNVMPQAIGAAQGKIIEDDNIGSITNKTDILLSGVQVKLNLTEQNLHNAALNINIGISSKFAKNNSFLGSNKQISGTYSSGSGGKMSTALNKFGFNDRQKYLVYNYLAHGLYQQELNDIILTKELLRLFSSAHSSDFSQYMLINGKIISIWQLVQYATTNSLYFSSSQSSNQGITLHIDGRKNILAPMEKDRAEDKENKNIKNTFDGKILALGWHRSRLKNEDINSARIEAKLHLWNLRKILK